MKDNVNEWEQWDEDCCDIVEDYKKYEILNLNCKKMNPVSERRHPPVQDTTQDTNQDTNQDLQVS